MSGRKLLSRSFEFLGVDQKIWLGAEIGGYGDDAVSGLLPNAAGAVDFNSCKITFNIQRDDSASRSGRSVTARLSGKKSVELSMESHIIPGQPDALLNPTLPPMHPMMITAFGECDLTNPAEIVYKLSRFNENSARILEEATHYARLTVGVIVDALKFTLSGSDKAMMTMDGFAQDCYIAGETKLVQAITGVEQLASLVVQDLTFTALVGSGMNGNLVQVEYITGGVAGSEEVTVSGKKITVKIATGVSLASEIKTAIEANAQAMLLVTIALTGADVAQVVSPVAYLVGGLGPNDFKVEEGKGILFEHGAIIDILGIDGDTMINQAKKVVKIGNKTVRENDLGVNADIITVDTVLLASPLNAFVIGHAPESYSPITSENALLGLKGSLNVVGIGIGKCEMISAEIGLTNNYTKKDFAYGTSKICGYIPDKRREVSLTLEVVLNKETLEFYMRNKSFVAEEVTITLEPQDICGPAYEATKGRTYEFYFPKVEFNIPDIENPADAYVTLKLEGKALAPSANELDQEFKLTIK